MSTCCEYMVLETYVGHGYHIQKQSYTDKDQAMAEAIKAKRKEPGHCIRVYQLIGEVEAEIKMVPCDNK